MDSQSPADAPPAGAAESHQDEVLTSATKAAEVVDPTSQATAAPPEEENTTASPSQKSAPIGQPGLPNPRRDRTDADIEHSSDARAPEHDVDTNESSVQSPMAELHHGAEHEPELNEPSFEGTADGGGSPRHPLPAERVDAGPELDDTSSVPEDVDVEDVFSDNGDDTFSDPGYAESSASSFYSTLQSDAEEFYWEHGHRYHNFSYGRYLLPNDDQELNREDMKHHLWRLILNGKLQLAPIPSHPQKILDVGTGSGIWAMQMADEYPSAEVIGFDLSPVQPSWVPPNLQFEIDDLEQEWLWKPNSFDLVHCRFMFVSVRDWPTMLSQAMRVLKPGGFIELAELDLDLKPVDEGMPYPPTIMKWVETQGQMLKRQGLDLQIARKFKGLLTDAGFESVVEHVNELPWGTWPEDKRMKRIGYWHVEQLKCGLHGILAASMAKAGWKPLEIEVFVAKLTQELNDPKWKLGDAGYVVYGRKPLA